MIKWINMCQCFLTFDLMLLRIYLQFICFNVATAICIISPPCLKRNQRNKLKQSIESVFSAQKHREARLQSDLHSFPLYKSSLINSQLTLWLCLFSLVHSRNHSRAADHKCLDHHCNHTVFNTILFAHIQSKGQQWTKRGKRGEKVILMNVLI